jgi:hypothetical protein
VIEYAYTDDEYDFVVDVQVEAWLEDGVFYAHFITIDPETGLPPQNVAVGFLLPENETGRGQGYVAYHVKPREHLTSGAAIRNIATIQFDFGLEIDTNQVDPLDKSKGTDPEKEALVTIDALSPVSRVQDLPSESPPQFSVSWSGTDDASGVSDYDVFVAREGAEFEPWLRATSLTSAQFSGESGVTYHFACLAVDNAGNREDKTLAAEATTTVSTLPPGVQIVAAGWEGNVFMVEVPTEPDRTYTLQYVDQLDDQNWQSVDQRSGDGLTQTLEDPDPPMTKRFYRVQVD